MSDRRNAPGDDARRLLIISPQPFYEDRGTPIAVRHLVTALAGLGFAVDLATFPVGRTPTIPGVRIVRAANPFGYRHVPVGFSIRKLVLDVCLAFTVLGLLRRHGYAAIHGVEEGGFIALLGRRSGARIIYDMQSSMPDELRRHPLLGLAPFQWGLRACERWLLGAVDLVACSGGLGERARALTPETMVREWTYPVLGKAPERSAIDALRRDLGIEEGAPVIVYTGTFEPYQGLAEVVDAIPRVTAARPDSVFVLVGADDAGERRVALQAADLGLNGSLRIVRRRPIEEINLYHALGDLLLAPRALGDNLPLKLFHYMAAGRPIVATGISPDNAIVGAGCARVVAHSPDAIAGAVVEVLGDGAAASVLAASAARYANERLGGGSFEGAVREMFGATPVANGR